MDSLSRSGARVDSKGAAEGRESTAAAALGQGEGAGAARERRGKEPAARNPWARVISARRGVTGRSLCCTGRVR